ncbi:mitogen-activated protein kinase kinase kinase 5 [Striga hermonthica]|uniref:mitogen-activated protein kinase kinase kinase n=1 Tax=Striga hermonthica TaxID=68872 RepID=A0A9N7MXF7_STRHE|nr:mitogen-activated protein kinase kinase kinase 5 [Striga hermonthica]
MSGSLVSVWGKSKKSSNDIILSNKVANSEPARKLLTRARKLRHASDDELGLNSSDAGLLPISPDSTLLSTGAAHWSKNPCRQLLGKSSNENVRETNVHSRCRSRGLFSPDLDVDSSQENEFHLHIPTRSAPGSGFSSPVLSPQRYNSTLDLYIPSFRVPSKFSNSDRKSKSYGNCNGVFMHLHEKSLPEFFALRNECNNNNNSDNNANVHPLPRPPSAACRQSLTVRHNIEKSDGSPVIKGQWQRGRLLGRGTYGSVYIATHRETGAMCAVKEVQMVPDDPKCAECVKQLEQEIKFLRDLKHRNIVQYYGCETIEDRFCIYLEYVHPGAVNKYIRENCGAMTESIVRNFTRHILSGLAYLHSTNTIHRDIKGANLLVDAYGVVKIADFGLAKHLNGHDIDLSLKGTPHWLAPEVLHAMMRKDANPELAYGVDIWSVGCTVIEMLTGKPPWSELTWVQAMFSVLNKSPPIPEKLSAEGKDFLQRCFQRRPEDRPSAAKLLDHPFVRSSRDQNHAGLVLGFSGIRLHVSFAILIICMPCRNLTQIETSRQDILCPGPNSHNSAVEALPRVSSNTLSPSNVDKNLLLRAVNNTTISCKGNLTLLMPKMTERKKKQSSNAH